jgi:DNA-directed RNA polymerase subunit H (RpoH/RPB5)
MEKLAQTLSEVWQVLDEQDRKRLATARHGLNDDNLLRFAGISLGLVVEKMRESVVTGEQAFFRYFVGAFV